MLCTLCSRLAMVHGVPASVSPSTINAASCQRTTVRAGTIAGRRPVLYADTRMPAIRLGSDSEHTVGEGGGKYARSHYFTISPCNARWYPATD
uniref:Putative secreted protein n=1 Tax=Anopheles darlingi TaxID=43151 RepID=A0A2M4D4U7_ANODA